MSSGWLAMSVPINPPENRTLPFLKKLTVAPLVSTLLETSKPNCTVLNGFLISPCGPASFV